MSRLSEASVRDTLGRRSPAGPSSNERHVRRSDLPVPAAAPTTGRRLLQMLVGIRFAECRANAFDVEAKRSPWSLAEPYATQLARAGIDPRTTHPKHLREHGCVDGASSASDFVTQQGDDPSRDRLDVVSVEVHRWLFPTRDRRCATVAPVAPPRIPHVVARPVVPTREAAPVPGLRSIPPDRCLLRSTDTSQHRLIYFDE